MIKDPGERLDYGFDWRAKGWLKPGEVIVESTWEALQTGMTIGTGDWAPSHDGSVAKLWLSGGVARRVYRFTNTIVTSEGRTAKRTLVIHVRDDRAA